MGRVLVTGALIAAAVLVVGLALIFASGAMSDGDSWLLVVNRGDQSLTQMVVSANQEDTHPLAPLGPRDSTRYRLTGLKEAFYHLDVLRADSSGFSTPVGIMVSDNIGIADTIYITDRDFRVVPPRDSSDLEWTRAWGGRSPRP